MNYFTLTTKQYPSIQGDESINLDNVDTFFKRHKQGDAYPYQISLLGTDSTLFFTDQEERNRAFDDLINAANNKNTIMNNTVTNDIKNFIKEHRQIIYWVVLALIVDHVFLNGQLTTKIKNIIHSLLNKAESSITGKPVATTETVEQPATATQS